MTLYEVVQGFLNIAKKQPNINYTGEGDVYTLNSLPNIEYSVFWVTQTDHTINEDTITYNLVLYYIDRVLHDESNVLEIQSNGINQLHNIINNFVQINDAQVEYDVNFTTFTHRFNDNCSGTYATVAITVDNNLGICGY